MLWGLMLFTGIIEQMSNNEVSFLFQSCPCGVWIFFVVRLLGVHTLELSTANFNPTTLIFIAYACDAIKIPQPQDI